MMRRYLEKTTSRGRCLIRFVMLLRSIAAAA